VLSPPVSAPVNASPLLCERLVIAVTGSPAALVMPQTVLMARQALASEVRVIMSRAAQRFVRPYTMRLFSGGWVHTETHSVAGGLLVPHVELTQDADLLLVMPATANAIAKAAHGLCDDLVSSAIAACPAPVALVPAMNGAMWANRAVQRNVAIARELGYHVVEPRAGVQLADLREAVGEMPPLEHILDELLDLVAARTLR
jgi:phosphopantothenoylcysteine decarboxylase/phosphopantothenate--cysteine ligase